MLKWTIILKISVGSAEGRHPVHKVSDYLVIVSSNRLLTQSRPTSSFYGFTIFPLQSTNCCFCFSVDRELQRADLLHQPRENVGEEALRALDQGGCAIPDDLKFAN